jgi:hypothetical protein
MEMTDTQLDNTVRACDVMLLLDDDLAMRFVANAKGRAAIENSMGVELPWEDDGHPLCSWAPDFKTFAFYNKKAGVRVEATGHDLSEWHRAFEREGVHVEVVMFASVSGPEEADELVRQANESFAEAKQQADATLH